MGPAILMLSHCQFRVVPNGAGHAMQIDAIELQHLKLNPHNDRHGSLRDEAAAIQWLLENRFAHMKALAKDLAETKKLYERPLVRQDGDVFVVFDGNRRTCCIKLLSNPALAPSEEWSKFFSDLKNDDVDAAYAKIECEVEPDLAIIDETLYRRHTGSQDGVGQSQWDPAGKSIFLQRTGKDSVGLGQSIETALKTEGLIDAKAEIPWSNLERLFSSEPIRKRAGFSFAGGSLTYLTDKKANLLTLQRIAQDLSGRKVVLGDLWNNAMKSRYLDRLKADGFAIDNSPSTRPLQGDSESEPIPPPPLRKPKKGRAPKDKNLISAMDQNPFMDDPGAERAERIWRELQFTLEFDNHDNAIAVLMRVLLELSVGYYARKQGLVFSQGDTLAYRVSAVADSMLNRGFIDTKARAIIRKFESDKPIVSAHTMQQYVHNANFHPSESDLKAIWNVIRPMILNSLR